MRERVTDVPRLWLQMEDQVVGERFWAEERRPSSDGGLPVL